MIIGTDGFVAWFYSVIWRLLQQFSRKKYGKYITHSLGVLFIIFGIYPIIRFLHPMLQFSGLMIILVGITFFVTPFGIKQY